MIFSNNIKDLDLQLALGKKKKEVLKNLIFNGIISKSTFDIMEKRIDLLSSSIANLKEVMENEKSYLNKTMLDKKKVFETILLDLEFKRLTGEFDEKECEKKIQIINSGITYLNKIKLLEDDSLENQAHKIVNKEQLGDSKINRELIKELPPIVDQPLLIDETNNSKIFIPVEEFKVIDSKREIEKVQRPREKIVEKLQCMNPWNSSCINSDIELSIYYGGRMIPVCRECWNEISRNNIEW